MTPLLGLVPAFTRNSTHFVRYSYCAVMYGIRYISQVQKWVGGRCEILILTHQCVRKHPWGSKEDLK
jgi:hypothetical protein